MKYPFIIFFRHEKYSEIDKFLDENKDKFNCTFFITSDKNDLNKLFNSDYQILVTYGCEESEYINDVRPSISDRMRSRWIHFKEIQDIDRFNQGVNYCFIHNCTYDREYIRPIFSVFSSTYNSYHKIMRAYESLKKQTMNDWEWVIMDDSPDDNHFEFLRKELGNDNHIRLYRRSKNSGNIGNVKNETVLLCRGKYVLEFDHDDIILPDTLEQAVRCFDENPEVGFVYMDFINIYENGNNFFYGDHICKGYGSYYCQNYEGKMVFVYNTPNINNITLTHLVCCPNHPRIWRKESLIKAGNYSEFLPICDDYEIILRTAINTKMAKINKFAYVQFMNDNSNNFSLIRNDEINRIGPEFISPVFYDIFKIDDKMKELGGYENEKYKWFHGQIWRRKEDDDKNIEESDIYKHRYCNLLLNYDYDIQYCIINEENLIKNLEEIKELYKNIRNDFILLDNNNSNEYIWELLKSHNLHDRFKFYNVKDSSFDEMKKFFDIRYRSVENYKIFE